VVLRPANHSCAGREGFARLGCNKDLEVGYDLWAVVHGKQLVCGRGSRKPHKNKLGIMKTSQALIDFQARGHELYTCFVFAAAGLNNTAERLRPHLTGAANQTMFVGNTAPEQGKPQARIKMQDLVAFSSKGGLFTDTLAKSLIVLLYAEWDELYRHRIAKEIGVQASAVRADLMGDIRHVRHWIVHNKSIVGTKALTVLPWQVSAGSPLVISDEFFVQFMDQLNEMQVYLDGAQQGAQAAGPASSAGT
jgi:hypothetical protein